MAREIELGVPAVDNFSAFELDGFTKRSGLTFPADFGVTFFVDGALLAVPFTISEIGVLGEYKIEFVPPLDGYYNLQVSIDFSKDVIGSSYQVVDELTTTALATIIAQIDKIDLVPTLAPNQATTGSLLDRLCNATISKTFNQTTDSLEGLRNKIGG